MPIRFTLLTMGFACLALAAGCTTASQGEAHPTTDVTTSRSSPNSSDDEELPFAGAPKVVDPLDTSRYEQDPCRSLTEAQAQSLNLPTVGTPGDEETLGTGCKWFNQETRGEVEIFFLSDDPRGLSPEYRANERGEWEYFEELPEIAGYPAVSRAGVDDRDIGRCTVVVGVADDMAFESIVQLSRANVGQKDSCDLAAQVAGMALQTMRGA